MPSPKRAPRSAHRSPSLVDTTTTPSRPAADNVAAMDVLAASSHGRRRSSVVLGTGLSIAAAGAGSGGNGTNGGSRGTVRPRGASLLRRDGLGGRIPEVAKPVEANAGDSDDDGWDNWGEQPSAERGKNKDKNSDVQDDDDDDEDDNENDGNPDDRMDDAYADLHDDEETGLTAKERQRRAQARRQRTYLDQRFLRPLPPVPATPETTPTAIAAAAAAVSEAADMDPNGLAMAITPDERKEADKAVVRRLVVNGTLVGLWYLFSLSLSLYNKWMFGSGKLNFAFPLFTTALHMLVQFGLSGLVLYCVPSLRPGRGGMGAGAETANDDDNDDDDDGNGAFKPERPEPFSRMTKWFYLTRVAPCGAATGLDIGLGNTSLKFITLTFYTMCKSSSLAFVLLFAFFFRLETPTLRLVAIIAVMTAGVVMMVAGEVEFKLGGFLLVISAAFFSGFRWGLTQMLLLRNPATSNPFSSILYLAPAMFATLFVLAVPIEGFPALIDGLRALATEWGPLRTPVLVLFPGLIAFCMTASEFALLQRTSVVTLSIAGIMKEVVTITTAALVFHDQLTPVNFLGLVITMAAIAAYNYVKIAKMRQDAQIDVRRGHHMPLQQQQQQQQGTYAGSALGHAASSIGVDASASGSDSDSDADVDDGPGAENAGLLHKTTNPAAEDAQGRAYR